VPAEPENRYLRIRLGYVHRIDAADVRDHEIGPVHAVGRDEVMSREQGLELAPKEDIDPTQQDRRHGGRVSRFGVPAQPLGRVARVDDGFESAFEAGVELIRAGEYFAAHEELEDAWRAAPPEERDFFQGLVHVAVAWYQAGRGRKIGTERQLAKALRRLEPFAPAHRGIDLEPLLAQLRELHELGSLELPAPLL
jgi:hypothetical protein